MTEQEFEELLQSISSNTYTSNHLEVVVRNVNGDTDGDTIIIDDDRTLLLTEAIKKNTYITKLDLSFNDITDIGAIAVASIKKLEELILYGNQVKIDGAVALAQSDLRTLDLGSNAFLKDLELAKKLEVINYFIQNKTITDLNLDYCIFSNEVVAELIKGNKVLKSLRLADNNLSDDCLKFLSSNNVLENLFLSSNSITDNGIEYILQNKTLKNINLGFNQLTIEGAKYLIGGSLDQVAIWNNDIPLETLHQFEYAFEQGKQIRNMIAVGELIVENYDYDYNSTDLTGNLSQDDL